MSTHICRSNIIRLRFDPAAAAHAGKLEGAGLLVAIAGMSAEDNPASLLNNALAEIIGLAVDNRIEECRARLEGFAEAVGPMLLGSLLNQLTDPAAEQRAIDAAIATCSQVSAGRIIAAHPNDDDAIVTLCELQMAVRAMEPKFTETEGGEI